MRLVCSVILAVLLFAANAFADAVYLKDGTIVRGKIVKEDDASVMVETGDTWRKIEKINIELIKNEQPAQPSAAPAPATLPGQIPATPSSSPTAVSAAPAPTVVTSSTPQRLPWYFGVQIPINDIRGDFDGTKAPTVGTGAGLGIIFGYAFTRNFALELDWAGSSHRSEGATIGFGEFSLNGKVMVPANAQLVPYLLVGYGSYTLGDSSLTFGGHGYAVGVGGDYYLENNTSLGIAFIRKVITYDEVVKGSAYLFKDLDGTTSSLRLDLTFHF